MTSCWIMCLRVYKYFIEVYPMICVMLWSIDVKKLSNWWIFVKNSARNIQWAWRVNQISGMLKSVASIDYIKFSLVAIEKGLELCNERAQQVSISLISFLNQRISDRSSLRANDACLRLGPHQFCSLLLSTIRLEFHDTRHSIPGTLSFGSEKNSHHQAIHFS